MLELIWLQAVLWHYGMHSINNYIQQMTSLIKQKKFFLGKLGSLTSELYALLHGYMRVGHSPLSIYYELLVLVIK